MPKIIIITGTPSDGFHFTGPFDGPEDAIRHAEEHKFEEWSTADMETPEEQDAEKYGTNQDEDDEHLTTVPYERFCVDGHEFPEEESNLLGDGQFAPFLIFDVDKQDYRSETYNSREEAEAAIKDISHED